MVVNPSDESDHRAAARKRNRQIPAYPSPHRREDDSTNCRDSDRKSSTTRSWPRVRASFVRNVEESIECVESDAAGKKPAQYGRGHDEDDSFGRCTRAPDRALSHLAVLASPSSTETAGL